MSDPYQYDTWVQYVQAVAEECEAQAETPDSVAWMSSVPERCMERWLWEINKNHHDEVMKAMAVLDEEKR